MNLNRPRLTNLLLTSPLASEAATSVNESSDIEAIIGVGISGILISFKLIADSNLNQLIAATPVASLDMANSPKRSGINTWCQKIPRT